MTQLDLFVHNLRPYQWRSVEFLVRRKRWTEAQAIRHFQKHNEGVYRRKMERLAKKEARLCNSSNSRSLTMQHS